MLSVEKEILFKLEDHVGTITLNRPDVRNAFGDNTRQLLLDELISAENDPEVRCVIITGAGKAFAAGGDIKSMREQQQNEDTDTIKSRMQTAGDVVTLIRKMSKPVIAAVNGAAAGGGLNLALSCDLRYAAENAIFLQSFVKIGLCPDWGGHYFLTQIVGTAKALELFSFGEKLGAQDAMRLGLVNDVYPQDVFMQRVHEKPMKLANAPADAIAAIKHCTYFSIQQSLEDTLRLEQQTQAKLLLSDNAREGMQAFIEKRTPNFNQRHNLEQRRS